MWFFHFARICVIDLFDIDSMLSLFSSIIHALFYLVVYFLWNSAIIIPHILLLAATCDFIHFKHLPNRGA